MKVEIIIDPKCKQPHAVLYADRMTDEVRSMARRLSGETETIAAQSSRGVELLKPEDVVRIYTEGSKVCAQTLTGVFTLKARLYEMEKRLSDMDFVRISSSELVNARMILGMDFSLTGTIRLTLKGNLTAYVSRRQVAKIKKRFER